MGMNMQEYSAVIWLMHVCVSCEVLHGCTAGHLVQKYLHAMTDLAFPPQHVHKWPSCSFTQAIHRGNQRKYHVVGGAIGACGTGSAHSFGRTGAEGASTGCLGL
mmetsp:Transcript_22694/g.69337  ORF Transcript_22694/g.69337 Transcript_22694/m.69337 type:complete len:104 (+) Transcript_22694:225-536(+)|eukprot:scaffold141737_cov36-Tisochrysis_lutea.AAC.2